MKLELPKNYQETNSENVTGFNIEMSKEQVAHFVKLHVTNLYTNPLTASIREIVSNAYDANNEALEIEKSKKLTDKSGLQDFSSAYVKEKEVVITLMEDRVRIRDYGVGLSEERIKKVYTFIGNSTKRTSDTQIGAFGIGRLAPLALNRKFIVENFYNGTKTVYCVFLDEVGIPSMAEWAIEKCPSEPNGLAVNLLLPDEYSSKDVCKAVLSVVDGSRYKVKLEGCGFGDEDSRLEKCMLYNNKVASTSVEGITIDYYLSTQEYSKTTTIMGYRPIYLCLDLGGALYHVSVNRDVLETHYSYSNGKLLRDFKDKEVISTIKSGTLIIRLEPGYCGLSTNRESVVVDKKKCRKILTLVEEALANLKEINEQRLQESYEELVKEYSENNATLSILSLDFTRYLAVGGERLKLSINKQEFTYTILPNTYIDKSDRSTFLCFRDVEGEQEHRGKEYDINLFSGINSTKSTFYSQPLTYKYYTFKKYDTILYGMSSLTNNKKGTIFRPIKKNYVPYLDWLIKYDVYIFLAGSGIAITEKRLVTEFGTDILEKTLLAIIVDKDSSVYDTVLKGLKALDGIVMFLGEYNPEIKQRTKKIGNDNNVVPTTEPKFLAQVKSMSSNYIHNLGYIKSRSKRITQDLTDKDLSRRLIYYSRDDISDTVYNSVKNLIHLDSKFYPEDLETTFVGLTDNAKTKLHAVNSNWVCAKYGAPVEVIVNLYNKYQLRVNLLTSEEIITLHRILKRAGHTDLLPKPTKEALEYFYQKDLLYVRGLHNFICKPTNNLHLSTDKDLRKQSLNFKGKYEKKTSEKYSNVPEGFNSWEEWEFFIQEKHKESYKDCPSVSEFNLYSLLGHKLQPYLNLIWERYDRFVYSESSIDNLLPLFDLIKSSYN